ncbi:hypothetical protein JL722_1818 [Aureococcus anophagefferens]|nr:hypothetical protein JL722_1818 [Aureococcus anophagefferens]
MEPARHDRTHTAAAAPRSRPDSDGDTPGETPLTRLLAPPAAPPLELLYGIIGGEARARKCLAARGRAAYRVPKREEVAGYTIPVLTLVQTCRDPAAHLPGRNLAARNKFGVTLLHKSLRYPNWSTSSFMMAADASLALYKDDLGRIPLHDACWNETLDFDVIVQLLEFDWTALVCYDARGHTPLCYAPRCSWAAWAAFFEAQRDRIVAEFADPGDAPPRAPERPTQPTPPRVHSDPTLDRAGAPPLRAPPLPPLAVPGAGSFATSIFGAPALEPGVDSESDPPAPKRPCQRPPRQTPRERWSEVARSVLLAHGVDPDGGGASPPGPAAPPVVYVAAHAFAKGRVSPEPAARFHEVPTPPAAPSRSLQ